MLSREDKIRLRIQLWLSGALIPVSYYSAIAWMKFVRRYRMPMLREVRREFRELHRAGEGPLVICCNHLTAVDSLLIMWALAPGWKCFLHPSIMPWNLPDKTNFSGNIYLRVMCYVGRCLPVVRRGSREELKRVMDKVQVLLGRGNSILIFPEGGRSRIKRVDTENFSYGVGSILQASPNASVLCVFFRGRQQKDFSNLPARGDEFYLDLQMIAPRSTDSGLRGARDISTQIVHALAAMEQVYFGTDASVARE